MLNVSKYTVYLEWRGSECSKACSLLEGEWCEPSGCNRRQSNGTGLTRKGQQDARSVRVSVPCGSSSGVVLVVPHFPWTGRKMSVFVLVSLWPWVPLLAGPACAYGLNFTRASCTSFPDVVTALSTPLPPISHSIPFRGQVKGTKYTIFTLCSGGQTSFSWIQNSDVKPEGRGRL